MNLAPLCRSFHDAQHLCLSGGAKCCGPRGVQPLMDQEPMSLLTRAFATRPRRSHRADTTLRFSERTGEQTPALDGSATLPGAPSLEQDSPTRLACSPSGVPLSVCVFLNPC
eukprot:360226-Chlamydomonas_euryale.AAC.1